MAKYTLTFDERVKGWTSFYSYEPEAMVSMNNDFYSIKDGQLYVHDDSDNPIRNNFYGQQYTSTLKAIINASPSDIKVIKAVNTESNKALDMVIKSYLNDETISITQSTISVSEFQNKEGKWYGFIRRNELTGDITSKATYGIGEVDETIASSVIPMSDPISTSLISVGDNLYDETNTLVGEILSYDLTANTITVDTSPTIAAGTFVYGAKVSRIEGSEIRGYNFEVDFTDNTTSRTELFALNCEVFKSFPS